MLKRSLRILAAWSCVVVVALTGVVPAQGLMLCLEPDGTLALELGFAENDCSGCTSEGTGTQPSDGAATRESGCPCVDIPLISSGEQQQLKRRTSQLQLDASGAPHLAPFTRLLLPFADPREVFPSRAPRPPPDLASIRTVVLRV